MQIAKGKLRCRCFFSGYPPWLSGGGVFVLSLVTAAAFGCGSVAFKAGGSAGDYQAAADLCRKQGRAESPNFERCMEEQGWVAKQLGAPTAASTASQRAPVEHSSPGSQAPTAPSTVQKSGAIQSPSSSSPAAPTAPSEAKKSIAAQNPSGDAQPATTAPSEAKKAVAAESPPPSVEPAPAAAPAGGDGAPSPQLDDAASATQPMVVKNWFKFGGTAEDLAAAQERCASKLGAAARPDPQSDVVSGAMVDCLRTEGWHAF